MQDTIILSNIARLYDGTSPDAKALRAKTDLFMENGRIRELRPHDPELPAKAQAGELRAELVDCSEFTVTPGLIDCHGHITILGLGADDMDRMNGPSGLLYVEKILHASLVEGGVTTMRDVGGATHLMKRLVDEGVLIGPRLLIAICMLSTTGGHADFRGPDRCHAEVSKLWPPGPGRPSSIVDGPWECRKRVREIAASGADLIKICCSPGVASPSDHLEHQDFSPEEVRAICDEAANRGLRVAAHAHSKSGIRLAIDNGVHDLQHISFMDHELAEMAHAAGCNVTPTSWVTHALLGAEGLSDFVRAKVEKVSETHAAAVAHANSGGLPILMGTDPVLPGMHGRNYRELSYLIRDGLNPLQAWYGATGLAADSLERDDVGKLQAGLRADLLLCRGDVVSKPELFDEGALVEVVKDGRGHRGLENVPQVTYRGAARDLLGLSEGASP